MDTLTVIQNVLFEAYGKTYMTERLSEHLAERVNSIQFNSPEERENDIMLTCWNWFSGGGAAAIAAERIEAALKEIER